MQRDSDSEVNPAAAGEEDQMLRPNEKKPRKKKSKTPVIVPASGDPAAGRVSVVVPPGQLKKQASNAQINRELTGRVV
jgi:hypothetical protein